MNQVTCKVGPALAAGCTMVLKPSQLSPLSALLFAEAVDEAGVPRRRVQHDQRRRRGAGRRVRHAPARRHGLPHRVDRRGRRGRRRRRPVHQARLARAGRQVGQHRVRRRERGEGRPLRHARRACTTPARPATRPRACWWRRRSTTRPSRSRPAPRTAVAVGDPRDQATFMGPVAGRKQYRDRTRLHPDRHGRGRAAGRRRARASGRPRQGLLRAADSVRRRDAGHAHLPGGDLRPRALHHAVPRRGARHRARQRDRVRPLRLRAVGRRRSGRGAWPAACAPAWCT